MQNLSFDLIKRKKYFSTVVKRLEGKNLLVDHGDLWAKLQISPANIYESLIHSVNRYLCETLNNSAIPCPGEMNSNASGISRFLSKPWHKVKDITPNGLIVPKHETIEAYGKILVSCVEIIETIVPEGHLTFHLQVMYCATRWSCIAFLAVGRNPGRRKSLTRTVVRLWLCIVGQIYLCLSVLFLA